MKNLFKTAAGAAVWVIGCMAGGWLWENVLEEKAVNLKNRLVNKK